MCAHSNQHVEIPNSADAIESWTKRIKRLKGKTLVVMEATGGFEYQLVEILQENGVDCSVTKPLQIRNFAKGLGLIEKNDRIDAKVIARFAATALPRVKEKPTETEKKLKALVARRGQILSQISAEFNRLQQTHDLETKEMIKQGLAFYKEQTKQVDKRIAQTLNQCQRLADKAAVLESCPGIGPATTGILLAELPELGHINRGKIAKLVVPHP